MCLSNLPHGETEDEVTSHVRPVQSELFSLLPHMSDAVKEAVMWKRYAPQSGLVRGNKSNEAELLVSIHPE